MCLHCIKTINDKISTVSGRLFLQINFKCFYHFEWPFTKCHFKHRSHQSPCTMSCTCQPGQPASSGQIIHYVSTCPKPEFSAAAAGNQYANMFNWWVVWNLHSSVCMTDGSCVTFARAKPGGWPDWMLLYGRGFLGKVQINFHPIIGLGKRYPLRGAWSTEKQNYGQG